MLSSCVKQSEQPEQPKQPVSKTEQTTKDFASIQNQFPINELNEMDSSIYIKSIDATITNQLDIPSFVEKDSKKYKLKITNQFVEDIKSKAKNIKKIRFGANVDLSLFFDEKNQKPGANFLFSNLEELIIEDGVTVIPSFSFGLNSKLKTVFLPNSIQEIGAHAFKDTTISEITLPSSLQHIGLQAFSNASLSKVLFNEGQNTKLNLSASVFENNLFTEFKFPKNIELVNFTTSLQKGGYPFEGCNSLTNISSTQQVKDSFVNKYESELSQIN